MGVVCHFFLVLLHLGNNRKGCFYRVHEKESIDNGTVDNRHLGDGGNGCSNSAATLWKDAAGGTSLVF